MKLHSDRFALLACGHSNEYVESAPPSIGDLVYCFRHAAYQIVTELYAGWAVKCRGCPYGRRHGGAKLTAQRAADAHHRAQPTHRVDVLRGAVVVESRNGSQDELPFGLDDAPPF